MTDDSERRAMEAETAKAKQKKVTGAVPNVTEDEPKNEATN